MTPPGEEPEPIGRAFGALVERMARRRTLWLALAAALACALAWYGSGLGLSEDIADFLPKDDPTIARHARAVRAFRGLDLLRVDLGVPGEGPAGELDRARLLAGARELELALVRAPELVARVLGEVRPEAALAVTDLGARSLPSLLEPATVAEVASRFSTDEAVDAQLERDLAAILGIEGTLYVQNVGRRDPLGLEGPFYESLKDLQAVAPGARLDGGRIVSADGRHVLFLVEPVWPASRTDEGEKLLALVEAAGTRATAAANAGAGPGAPLVVSTAGGHRASIENATTIKRDAELSSILSLASMLAIYALIFPRRWLIPLTALPLAFGGIVGAASCRLLLGDVSKIALGFGGILLGLADDFIVHLYYFYEQRAKAGDPHPGAAAVARIARPTLAAGASIAAAFAALAFSGFPGQRDLAVFAATSLCGTLAFCLLVQPLLLPDGPSPRPLTRAHLPLRALVHWVERHERAIVPVAALATLVLGVAATRVRFEDDPRAIEARSPAAYAAEDALSARWGNPSGMALVVAEGPDLEAALEQNDRVAVALEALRRKGEIAGASSIAALAPSRRTQEERRAAWTALWTPERRGALAERLARLGPRHRFKATAFSAFLERLEGTGQPVSVPDLARGPLRDLVGRRIAEDGKGCLVLTVVTLVRGADGAPRLGWVSEAERATGAVVTTGHGFARALVALVQRKLAWCAGLAFLVVLAILVPALRKPRLVLAAALPLAVGLAWSLGTFALAGTALNAINFLIPVLTFGLSVDYVLFLASGYGQPSESEAEVEQAEGAVVSSASTTLTGMASLLVARHPALWSVGVVALVGTTASLLAIFLITPALLRRRTPPLTPH